MEAPEAAEAVAAGGARGAAAAPGSDVAVEAAPGAAAASLPPRPRRERTPAEEEAASRAFSGHTAWARNMETPLRMFLRTETGSASVLAGATVLAVIWANISISSYDRFWATQLSVLVGSWGVNLDLRQFVNSGLMALFFFVVGLEARREFDVGELRVRSRLDAAAARRAGRHGRARRHLPDRQRRAARRCTPGACRCPPTPPSRSARSPWSAAGCPTGSAPTCSPSPWSTTWPGSWSSRWPTAGASGWWRCWSGWRSRRWSLVLRARGSGPGPSTCWSASRPGWRSSSPASTRSWSGWSSGCSPTPTRPRGNRSSRPPRRSGCSASSPRPSWRSPPGTRCAPRSRRTTGWPSSSTRGPATSSCRCSRWPTPGSC